MAKTLLLSCDARTVESRRLSVHPSPGGPRHCERRSVGIAAIVRKNDGARYLIQIKARFG